MRCEIIYEDKEVLVIYKPAGLATQTARVGQPDAVSELKNYLAKGGIAPYLGIIHRLDQPVEGLLVFAKNKMAAAALTAQLGQKESGIFNKQYRAVVCGKAEKKQDTLVDNLVKLPDGRAEIAASDNREAKRAVLRYECLAEQKLSEEITISLMEISIETGRFHQIRVQMANAGLPLLGDLKYGGEEEILVSGQLSVRFVALCACRLVFRQPVTGKELCFEIRPRGEIFHRFAE